MAGSYRLKCKACLPGSTPSVIACGDATFPKGTAFGGDGKVSGIAKRRPLGGAGCERSEQTEGVIFYEPTRENGMPERLQTLRHSQSFYLCALPHQFNEHVHLRGYPFVPVVE